MPNIPLVDLKAQYQSIKYEIDSAIAATLENADFIQGKAVSQFESAFAAFLASPNVPLYCTSCANGTDAIYLALRALGIEKGDEVITVAHTFIATAEAITQVGADVKFVDIDEKTMLMDPDALEAAISSRTKAIILVHLYGQMCDMDAIMAIAKKHRLKVIEDSAQAHGAKWKGQSAGTFGDIATFSFYPGKNLGCFGDGGAIVSRSAELINLARMLANHGRIEKYEHQMEGVNSRLDTIQAAILFVKLRYLKKWNELRQEHASWYLRQCAELSLVLPFVDSRAQHVWHLFVIRTEDRAKLQEFLKTKEISSGVHYPIPLHLQPAYTYKGLKRGDLPVTEKVASQILSIPLYPELDDNQKKKIVGALHEWVPLLCES